MPANGRWELIRRLKVNKVLHQSSHGGAYISRVVLHTQRDDDRQTLQPFNARLIKGLTATP